MGILPAVGETVCYLLVLYPLCPATYTVITVLYNTLLYCTNHSGVILREGGGTLFCYKKQMVVQPSIMSTWR